MSAYTIVQGIVTDPDKFIQYIQAVPAVVAQYGGRYLVQGSDSEVFEGTADSRKVVVHEWPSADMARRFWNSAEYQRVKQLRQGAGEFQVTLVEGVVQE